MSNLGKLCHKIAGLEPVATAHKVAAYSVQCLLYCSMPANQPMLNLQLFKLQLLGDPTA
jgi:hypothetical protein